MDLGWPPGKPLRLFNGLTVEQLETALLLLFGPTAEGKGEGFLNEAVDAVRIAQAYVTLPPKDRSRIFSAVAGAELRSRGST